MRQFLTRKLLSPVRRTRNPPPFKQRWLRAGRNQDFAVMSENLACCTSTDFLEAFQRNYPTGKSLLIFRNRVKPRIEKYFAFHVGQITGICFANPAHTRGVSRSSRCVGLGCDGRFGVRRGFRAGRKRRSVRPSRVVLAPRCWR